MALLDYVVPAEADAATRELLEKDAEYYGRPSLFARAVANNPDVFDARRTYHRRLVSGGDLGERVAELVYLAVSVTNDCPYCIASHREVLVEHVGVPSEDAEALARGDLSGFTAPERAAVEFATVVAKDPKAIDDAHRRALREVGFDDAAVVRLLAVATAAISANAVADALGIDPADAGGPLDASR